MIKKNEPHAMIAVGGDGTGSLIAKLLASTHRIPGIMPEELESGFLNTIKVV